MEKRATRRMPVLNPAQWFENMAKGIEIRAAHFPGRAPIECLRQPVKKKSPARDYTLALI